MYLTQFSLNLILIKILLTTAKELLSIIWGLVTKHSYNDRQFSDSFVYSVSLTIIGSNHGKRSFQELSNSTARCEHVFRSILSINHFLVLSTIVRFEPEFYYRNVHYLTRLLRKWKKYNPKLSILGGFHFKKLIGWLVVLLSVHLSLYFSADCSSSILN